MALRLITSILLVFLGPLGAFAQDAVPRPVKLLTLSATDMNPERRFYGQVRARETVDLAFQVGGRIVSFPVTEGSRIEKGALVAELDLTRFELQAERARIDTARAERDLGRLTKLGSNVVSDVQVQDAQTSFDLAQVGLDEASEALENATLRAEFDALVARREVANYTIVSAGQPVVRLHDMSELRVDIEVPEVLFRRASAGENVTFSASFPNFSESFPLVMREFEAETDGAAQTFTIKLAFVTDVPDWLLPGASAVVHSVAPAEEGAALVLPQTAVLFGPDRAASVMVFSPSEDDPDTGTVEQVGIEIAMRNDGRIEMTDGPEAGTQIVATGPSRLQGGQTVRRYTGLGQ